MEEGKFYNWLAQLNKEYPYKVDRLRMRLGLLNSQEWSKVNKTFIVSTGRTGTKFFARFLNKLDNVYAKHEPKPDFLNLAIDYVRNRVKERKVINTIEKNRRALAKDVKRKEAEFYVESNNRFFSLLDFLDDIFNNFKIVHIIRDGRDYVRSGMGRIWYTKEDTDPRMKASYFPNDPYYDKWDEMSRFEKICWRWQKKDGFILDSIEDMSNVITVKFADIFKDKKHSGLYQICDYIGLDKSEVRKIVKEMMNRKVNSTKEYAISKWTEWDIRKKRQFDEIAGDHMENYYDYEW